MHLLPAIITRGTRVHRGGPTLAVSRPQATSENLSDCGRPGRRCSLLQPAFSEARPSGRGKAGIAFPSGEVVGRVQAGGARRYYLKDHLGSIRAVLDGGGASLETRDYYPFGLPMPGRYEVDRKKNIAGQNRCRK